MTWPISVLSKLSDSGAGLLLAARLSATSLILSVGYSKAESNPVPVGTATQVDSICNILHEFQHTTGNGVATETPSVFEF